MVVIGSGAGGLSAAVAASFHGLKVIVAEKEPVFGGTTAWSGGWMWAPLNPLAQRAGIVEDREAPRNYLRHVLGNNFDAARVDAFLDAAPRMVAFFEQHTALQFEGGLKISDIYGDVPGAGTGGRSVIAAPFDARALGELVDRLRLPLRETAFMGMTIQSGADLSAFMNVTRSARAFAHVTRRFGRHLIDLALHQRGMQLRNGNALIGRLLKSAADLGVTLRASSAAIRLRQEGSAVTGVVLRTPEGEEEIRVRRGVVLAAGGFPHDRERWQAMFPADEKQWPLAVPAASGDGVRLGESAGGEVDRTLASPAAWCPVSLVPYPDGSVGRFPHIIERGKPGIIGVLADGRRFCNEGNGYYDYVVAMQRAVPSGEEVASWLICTHAFQRRYGLGITRPTPLPVAPSHQIGLSQDRPHHRGTGAQLRHRSCGPRTRDRRLQHPCAARRGSRLRPWFDAV